MMIVFGAESAIAIGGGEGTDDALALPCLEGGEEGVAVKFDIPEEGEVVAPVRSLL
jgi:hypothetical protein